MSGRGRRLALPRISVRRGPDSERIRAFFFCATGRGGRSLTTCRKDASVLAAGMPCNVCGCSSVGRARPRHGRGHEFETRHPLHFGCAHALRGHARVSVASGCARPLARSRAARTPHPTGCSRVGTAEVDRSPGHTSRSSRRRGHHPFKVDTRVRVPHATPPEAMPR